jgi:hypothetical protein
MTTTPDLWRNPFLDNTSLTGAQDSGVVAPTASNTFFAVWVDRTNFNMGVDSIIARKFDSLGNPLTAEIDLTAQALFDRDQPDAVRLPIAGAADGLAVAFTTHFPTTEVGVFRLDGALNIIGGNGFGGPGDVDHPSITSFSNGSLWVSYTLHNSATDSDILASRIDANGSASAPITIFTDAANTLADNSALATLVNGNVVAVFQAAPGNSPFNNDVFYTIKTQAGTDVVAVTPVFGANDGNGIDESDAHVAALADGGFVVTWTDQQGLDIRASVYDASGNLVQGNILVNFFHQQGQQFSSDVTALPDGGFIVAWEDNFDLVERAQRFDEAGNLVGTDFTWVSVAGLSLNTEIHTNAATYSDGRVLLTMNPLSPSTAEDVQTSIWDTRITDANQTTGENFFGAGGGPGDLFLIRDTFTGGIPVRQLEAIQTNGTATVFGTVGTNQAFVGSGDFNGDGLSDLLINVDNPANGTRAFLVDQMNPGGIQAQFQIAVRGADWVVDAMGDFNNNGTDDILVHRDVGGNRTLEVMVMNNNAVQANITLNVNGINWDVDGTGDFNGNGTSDVLQHQISLANGSMTLRALVVSNNVVQSAPTLGTIGASWQVDGTGDFNHDGTSDILVHQDSTATGARTFQVLTIQNNAVVAGTTIAQTGTNISVGGIGDFNGDGTSDILMHQDTTTRTDIVYNVVNNVAVSTQTVAVTGIDWHVA